MLYLLIYIELEILAQMPPYLPLLPQESEYFPKI